MSTVGRVHLQARLCSASEGEQLGRAVPQLSGWAERRVRKGRKGLGMVTRAWDTHLPLQVPQEELVPGPHGYRRCHGCLRALEREQGVPRWLGPSSSSLLPVKAEELLFQWLLSNPGAALHKQ